MPIISIEACIGSGKSTLLDLLKNKYSNNNKVVFVPEPVDKWLETRDETGKDILATFYEDKKRWGYSFQMNAFITRCKSIIAENDNNDKLIILERSIYTDKHVFANYLNQCGDIGLLEINLYNEWFEWLSSKFPVTPSHYIYLKCDTNVAYQRVIKRCREAEMGHIPLEYLEAINDKHDKWLTTLDNVSIIDVNNDFQYDQNNRDTILNNVSLIIDSHISKLA
jgi:deoxyadenosine/deoxycytidine kinase